LVLPSRCCDQTWRREGRPISGVDQDHSQYWTRVVFRLAPLNQSRWGSHMSQTQLLRTPSDQEMTESEIVTTRYERVRPNQRLQASTTHHHGHFWHLESISCHASNKRKEWTYRSAPSIGIRMNGALHHPLMQVGLLRLCQYIKWVGDLQYI
jgi:hypothetical protein